MIFHILPQNKPWTLKSVVKEQLCHQRNQTETSIKFNTYNFLCNANKKSSMLPICKIPVLLLCTYLLVLLPTFIIEMYNANVSYNIYIIM